MCYAIGLTVALSRGYGLTEGFSVLIPTQNMLLYLKDCLSALERNSKLTNEIIVCNDGSSDGTREWLQEAKAFIESGEHKFSLEIINREPKGCFSGWNACAKKSSKEWLMAWQDDMHALPYWDEKLKAWIENSPERQWGIQIIEPFPSSYLTHNSGNSVEEFREQDAIDYAKSVMAHTYKQQVFAHSAINRTDWQAVGGLDERFDPTASGWPDFQEALHRLRPRAWNIVNDSFLYHFKPKGRLFPYPDAHVEAARVQRNLALFYEKWGVHVGPEHEQRLGQI